MNIKAFFLDDHEMFRQGVKLLLEDEAIDFVGEAGEGKVALTSIAKLKPDVLLIDIELPDMNGLEVASEALEIYPDLNILIVSNHHDTHHITSALKTGVKGYILKNADKTDLFNAISVVSSGQSFFSYKITQVICSSLISSKRKSNADPKLSNREKEILKLIVQGMKNNEIAKQLYISTHTVITHRRNLLQKSGTNNTAGLVNFASKIGLL